MKHFTHYLVFIKKYEIILISGIIIGVVLMLSFLFLKQNFDKASNINKEQLILKSKLEKLTKKDNQLSSLDDRLYRDSFPKIGQVLPDSKEYVSLFSTFDNLEKNLGVTITRTDFQLGVVSTNSSQLVRDTGSSAYVVPMTIEVIGDLASIQKFISSLSDYSGRFMTIESLAWEINNGGNYIVTVGGKAYYYPLPITLGSIDAPLPKISANQDKIFNAISRIKIIADDNSSLNVPNLGKKDLFQ